MTKKKLTYEELKGDRDYFRIIGIMFCFLFLITVVYLVFYIFYSNNQVSNLQAENEQLREQVSIQKYKCPPLDEIGEYTINEKGELTSPSGKIINCEVIE